jgi:predicted amidohydrolase YtcJ
LASRANADLILHHGRIYPVDAAFSVAEAIAIADGRVQAIGTSDTILGLAGSHTRRVNLNGATVLPGFFDGHTHAMSIGINLVKVDLSNAASIDDVLSLVKARAAETPPGEWIEIAPTWHESTLRERRFPSRAELDDVAPANPVYLPRGTRFFAVTNSAGFVAAGIDGTTPDPEGGRFERDASGELTGLMLDPPAFNQVKRLLPPITQATRVRALHTVHRAFNRVGITSVIDPALNADEIRAYQAVWEDGSLSVRTTGIVAPDTSVPLQRSTDDLLAFLDGWAPRSGFGDNRFRIGPLKLWVDGFIETAWLKEGYANDPEFHGVQAVRRDVLLAVLRRANELDWQVALHVVGDAALEMTLDVFAEVNREKSIVGRRWTVMHALFPTERVFRLCREMDVQVSVQQGLSYAFGESMLKCWGPERAAYASPFRTWIDRGFRLAGGSDVIPFDPLTSIWSTVTRMTRAAGVLGHEQAATRQEAVAMYTANPPYLTFEEDVKGRLEPGKLADLVVLSEDPLRCEEEAIRNITVVATILEGKLVYGGLDGL